MKLVQNVCLVIMGCIIAFFLSEFMAVFFLPAPTIYPFPQIIFQAAPEYGYRYQPSQKGFIAAGSTTINRWGFRGRDWDLTKADGVQRVILLGDSYTAGQGVSDENTAAAQLELLLNQEGKGRRYEVLNFSVTGYDQGHEIKVLENEGLRFQPDIVVLHFFLNDLLYIKDYSYCKSLFKGKGIPRWKLALGNLVRRSRILMLLNDRRRSREENDMTRIEKSYLLQKVTPPQGPGQEGWEFVIKQLKRFHDLSVQYHFKAILAIIPAPSEIVGHFQAPYEDYLIQKSMDLDIIPLSLISNLKPTKPTFKNFSEFLIPYDVHLSIEGNHRLAESLAVEIFKMQKPPQ